MFTIIGARAQLERDIIRERVKAGLDRARYVKIGRRLLMDVQDLDAYITQSKIQTSP